MIADRMRNRFEKILDRPGPDRLFSAASLLGGISAAYGGAMALRAALYRRGVYRCRRLCCPVVSVGNLTVGGTGKTPMVVYLARRLHRSGLRPVVISRGYGGSAQRTCGIVSDGTRRLLSPGAAGDEPWMVADLLPGVPVVVGKDRFCAGNLARKAFSPDVILLDDGFQHLRLHRDLNLLLLDAQAPLGNRRIFPRGRLREPAGAASRADAIVLTRSEDPCAPLPEELAASRAVAALPVFRAVHTVLLRRIAAPARSRTPGGAALSASGLAGRRVFGFSGIADNEAFAASIRRLGGRPVSVRAFADHHRYQKRDLAALQQAATGADLLATTEKDFARLGGRNPFDMALAVVGVEIEMVSGKQKLDGLMAERLARGRD